jgi:hypothetical protein
MGFYEIQQGLLSEDVENDEIPAICDFSSGSFSIAIGDLAEGEYEQVVGHEGVNSPHYQLMDEVQIGSVNGWASLNLTEGEAIDEVLKVEDGKYVVWQHSDKISAFQLVESDEDEKKDIAGYSPVLMLGILTVTAMWLRKKQDR